MSRHTPRPGVAVLVAAALGMPFLGAATAVAGETAPVPEDYVAPRSTVEVTTVWEAPRSTVSVFYTDPEQAEGDDLEESVGAEVEGDETVVALSDRFLFDFDSAQLRPTASASLDTIVALLLDGDSSVDVIGHTDSLGGDAVNLPLSQERADAVADYLVENGIDEERITTDGVGSSEPVADNTYPDGRDNPEGRQQNRRVEIRYATD